MMLHRLLEEHAQRTPDAVALLEPRRLVSYGELDRLANRFAALLVGAGVARHDRVLLALENSIELAGAYLGAMKAGACAVPLPGGAKSDRLDRAIADCQPAAAIVDAATARGMAPADGLGSVGSVYVATRPGARPDPIAPGFADLHAALERCSDAAAPVRGTDIDLAAIIYTSGSTGAPRGVMLTHRNLVANARSIVQYLGLTAADRVMCVLPFYYVYGLSLLHTHLLVGGSVCIDNRFTFPNVVLRAMQERAVTGFAGVPSTFSLLLHRSELDQTTLPALRYVTQAGGPMPPARITEWLQRGPRVPFFVMYGATEAAARLTYLDPARLVDKLGSIGRAIPNVEILVRRDDGSVAAPGEIGELVARGTNVSAGYWNDPEATREKFGALGYHTGDLGFADGEGFLFVVGRKDDMLKVGAHRVGAQEIERVLYEYPGLHEAAVVGAPHDLLGQVPVAFVAFGPEASPDVEHLRTFCRCRLPSHKVPARFSVVAELPKLGSVGKIDRRALVDLAAATLEGAAAVKTPEGTAGAAMRRPNHRTIGPPIHRSTEQPNNRPADPPSNRPTDPPARDGGAGADMPDGGADM